MENLSQATANYSDCFLVDNASRKRVFLFFYLFIIITAIPSNIFSLVVAWNHIRQKNELGVYLFNLALSDLSYTVGLFAWTDFLWKGVWMHGAFLCVLSLNILFTNFYTSEALLCCISVDRYLAVVHPFKYVHLRKVSTAAGVSVAIWTVVVGFNAAAIRLEDSYYENEQFSLCLSVFLPMSEHVARATVARFCLGFVIPVSLMVFTSWRICMAVESNQATDQQEWRHVSRLMIVILLCLVICFGPVHVVMLLQMLADDCKSALWLLYLDKISVAVSSLNCIADPFVYCFVTRTGMANIKRLLFFFRGKRRSTGESEEQTEL